MRACGMKMDKEDADLMYYSTTVNAFPLTQRVPDEYNGLVLRIYTDGVHPGYAILIDEPGGKLFKHLA